jgi:hypothetical protein
VSNPLIEDQYSYSLQDGFVFESDVHTNPVPVGGGTLRIFPEIDTPWAYGTALPNNFAEFSIN